MGWRMGDGTSRRDFLATTLCGAAAVPLARLPRLSLAPARSTPKTFLEPFDYDGVVLLDGPLKSQFDTMRAYYFAIPNDDILKGFRARAGQRARGEELGGWYSGDPKRRTWWSNGDTFNTFGQWLSGLARLSRAANDAEMRNKAIFLMSEWASTIAPD